MKVGIWFDLRNPPRWRQDPARLYGFTLELCEEAEHPGAASLWFSEHHRFEDGYLPQPLTFAAAAAGRTIRARLGTGILVAPLRKTAQLAEEAAVVDVISGGRLDLGLGAGYRVPPERDRPLVAPHIAYAQDGYRRYMVEGTGRSAPRPVDPERLRAKGPDAGPMSYVLRWRTPAGRQYVTRPTAYAA